MRIIIGLTFVVSLLLPLSLYAEDGVAKVIIIKGIIMAQEGGKEFEVKKDMWLKEGVTLESRPKSFAKLLFIDKSQISLGPESQMVITQFPKQKAGIISLIKGQLRSQVTKDYMDMNEKDTSKLYIQTKTAAMGVRGTDFQVLYNDENKVTSLVTFEGAVAMAKIDEKFAERSFANANIDRRELEKVVSSPEAVVVEKGQFSGVNPELPKATIPTKINPNQLEIMRKSTDNADASTLNGSAAAEPAKQYRNMVPPGVDTKSFMNNAAIDKQMVTSMGADAAKSVADGAAKDLAKGELKNSPPPEGFVNAKTGDVAPPAGGFIDLKTALYIPPPPGSTFDANSGVYVPPPSMGSFNAATGGYVPPAGMELKSDGRLTATHIPSPSEMVAKNASATGVEMNRAPASVPGAPQPGIAPTTMVAPPPVAVGFGTAPIVNYGTSFSYAAPSTSYTGYVAPTGTYYPTTGTMYPTMGTMYPATGTMDPMSGTYMPPPINYDNLINNYQETIYQQYNNAPPPTDTVSNSRVKFIVN